MARSRPALLLHRMDLSELPLAQFYFTELAGAWSAPGRGAKENLQLYVDGLPAPGPLAVRRADQPVALVLVLRVSGVEDYRRQLPFSGDARRAQADLGTHPGHPSPYPSRPELLTACSQLLHTLPPASEVRTIALGLQFLQTTGVAAPHQADVDLQGLLLKREALGARRRGNVRASGAPQQALRDSRSRLMEPQAMGVPEPGPQLTDALTDALGTLARSSLRNRHLVVLELMAPGRSALRPLREVARRIRDQGIAVHVVSTRRPQCDDSSWLGSFVSSAGGSYHAPETAAATLTAFAEVAQEVTTQLVATYDLQALLDGQLHDFSLEVPAGVSSEPLTAELPALHARAGFWGLTSGKVPLLRCWIAASLAVLHLAFLFGWWWFRGRARRTA